SYQGALIEATGLQKVKDLYAWRWEVGPEMPRRCMAAHREMLDMGFKFRPTDLWKEMDELVAIFDNAWQHNWGYVPMTRAEADQRRNELRLILDPEIAIVATLNGELVAMGIATPNLHEAINDFGGKVTPMNIAKLLWRMKVTRPKSARLAFLGVKEHIRKQKKYMPIALALINELNRRGYQRGYQWGELSWT